MNEANLHKRKQLKKDMLVDLRQWVNEREQCVRVALVLNEAEVRGTGNERLREKAQPFLKEVIQSPKLEQAYLKEGCGNVGAQWGIKFVVERLFVTPLEGGHFLRIRFNSARNEMQSHDNCMNRNLNKPSWWCPLVERISSSNLAKILGTGKSACVSFCASMSSLRLAPNGEGFLMMR